MGLIRVTWMPNRITYRGLACTDKQFHLNSNLLTLTLHTTQSVFCMFHIASICFLITWIRHKRHDIYMILFDGDPYLFEIRISFVYNIHLVFILTFLKYFYNVTASPLSAKHFPLKGSSNLGFTWSIGTVWFIGNSPKSYFFDIKTKYGICYFSLSKCKSLHMANNTQHQSYWSIIKFLARKINIHYHEQLYNYIFNIVFNNIMTWS